MPQDFLATARITCPYTYSGVIHKAHAYVRGAQLVGSLWKINSRSLDANDLDWHYAADALDSMIGSIMPTGATFGTFTLEQLINSVWVTVDSGSSTATVTADTPANACVEVITTLRDTAFNKVKVCVLDAVQLAGQKYLSPTEGDAHLDTFMSYLTGTHADQYDPYNWMVSRSNHYLAVAPFVSATVMLNRKLRRRRGRA